MKLGRRQALSISDILNEGREEISAAYHARNRMQSQSRLVETLMFEAENPDNFEMEVSGIVSEKSVEMAQAFLKDLDKAMYKVLADTLKKYGVEKMSPTTLSNDLEDFDQDGVMEVQQELVSDITAAAERYVDQIALLVHNSKLAYTEEV
jgi:hypothetical protein